MWVTAHEAVLSRVSSARTPRLPAFPQLRYAPRPPAQKPIGVTSSPFRKPAGSTGKRRGDRGGDAVTIRARDLPPLFHLPVRLARGKSRAATLESPRSNRGISTGQPLRPIPTAGWASRPLRFPSSSSVPFNSFKFMRSCPTGGSLARHVAARSSGSSRRRLSDLMSFRA